MLTNHCDPWRRWREQHGRSGQANGSVYTVITDGQHRGPCRVGTGSVGWFDAADRSEALAWLAREHVRDLHHVHRLHNQVAVTPPGSLGHLRVGPGGLTGWAEHQHTDPQIDHYMLWPTSRLDALLHLEQLTTSWPAFTEAAGIDDEIRLPRSNVSLDHD